MKNIAKILGLLLILTLSVSCGGGGGGGGSTSTTAQDSTLYKCNAAITLRLNLKTDTTQEYITEINNVVISQNQTQSGAWELVNGDFTNGTLRLDITNVTVTNGSFSADGVTFTKTTDSTGYSAKYIGTANMIITIEFKKDGTYIVTEQMPGLQDTDTGTYTITSGTLDNGTVTLSNNSLGTNPLTITNGTISVPIASSGQNFTFVKQ
ncbi:MAG: hypothetical protein J5597_00545 [Spirochaetaceae bacterium]|nr:hypothetical protein [Spirochaetaceae bacterium]